MAMPARMQALGARHIDAHLVDGVPQIARGVPVRDDGLDAAAGISGPGQDDIRTSLGRSPQVLELAPGGTAHGQRSGGRPTTCGRCRSRRRPV